MSSADSDSDVEEDFGQSVVLTARIRGILRGYPEGSAVLKELLQNADDAGARCVRVLYDERKHGNERVLYPGLKGFQGPAICVYNDATFTDADFASICRIGDSGKAATRTKVGRFGVGFNAVYHLTDVPMFVSGKHIVFFDPHFKHVGTVGGGQNEPGKRIKYTPRQGQKLITEHGDTFAPFQGMFGLNFKIGFEGTLFRFPLRTEAQAQISDISKAAYTAQKAEALITSFCEEAAACLLFLRSVEVVEIYRWSAGAKESTLVKYVVWCAQIAM